MTEEKYDKEIKESKVRVKALKVALIDFLLDYTVENELPTNETGAALLELMSDMNNEEIKSNILKQSKRNNTVCPKCGGDNLVIQRGGAAICMDCKTKFKVK